MFNDTKSQFLYASILLLIALASCSTPQPEASSIPTTDPYAIHTRIAQNYIEALEVTWDGNECVVSGPSKVSVGKHQFIFRNNSDQSRTLYMSHLRDGHTFQDVLDLQSKPGVWYPRPSWAVHPPSVGRRDSSIDASVYYFSLNDEGEYSIHLGGDSPLFLWFCSPLMVVEAPSE